MNGIGKSIRENAEAGYWYHCREVSAVIFRVHKWPWKDWARAANQLFGALWPVLCLLLFPVIIPIAGYTRHRYYRRQMAEWQARKDEADRLHGERVQRVQSRVKKI